MTIWNSLLYQPLVNLLIFFYNLLGRNLGLAIIALTIAVRGALLPLTMPSMRAASKIKELKPELDKLKDKYGDDKQKMAKKQMELYKKHGINPAAGCLPQIIQFVVLIALFQAFRQVLGANGEIASKLNELLYSSLKFGSDAQINTKFLYLDLVKPDLVEISSIKILGLTISKLPGFFLISAVAAQFLTSKIMLSASKTFQDKAKKSEEKEEDFASAMQKQTLYTMPLITFFIGIRFPSGLVLYWFTFSLFMMAQQIFLKKEKKDA